jgi:hypothetical protein
MKMVTQSHALDMSGPSGDSSGGANGIGIPGATGNYGQNAIPQNPISQMGMGLISTPVALAIICFALGMAAPHMFKRRDPAVIYRPNVGMTPPSIFTPNWQGYAQRTTPDLVQPGSFCQYRPYFVGQELEIRPGQPKPQPMSYQRVKQMSQNFTKSSSKMVRRFLEL